MEENRERVFNEEQETETATEEIKNGDLVSSEKDNLKASEDIVQEETTDNQEQEKTLPANAGFFYLIRMLAGGYLVYLAYGLVKEIPETFKTIGWSSELLIRSIAGLVFIGFGGFLLVKYFKLYNEFSKQYKK